MLLLILGLFVLLSKHILLSVILLAFFKGNLSIFFFIYKPPFEGILLFDSLFLSSIIISSFIFIFLFNSISFTLILSFLSNIGFILISFSSCLFLSLLLSLVLFFFYLNFFRIWVIDNIIINFFASFNMFTFYLFFFLFFFFFFSI